MYKITFYSLLLIVALCGCHRYTKFSNYDISHQYKNNSRLNIEHRVVRNGDNLSVYMAITPHTDQEFSSSSDTLPPFSEIYTLHHRITDSYESRNTFQADTVEISSLRKVNGTYHIYFTIQKIPSGIQPVLLIVDIYNKKEKKSHIVDIPAYTDGRMSSQYFIYEKNKEHPAYEDAVFQTGDTLSFRSTQALQKQLFVKVYKADFDAALPMAVGVNADNRLVPEKVFIISINQWVVAAAPGLYFVQEDTATQEGMGFLVEEGTFPKMTTVQMLTDPLIYITTRNERNRFKYSRDQKEELDKFWLSIAGNKEYARRLIKGYYTQAQDANKLFSGYKSGWKTDRGMIYTIFGPPEEVYRFDGREEWRYNKPSGTEDVTFVFIKRRTIFEENNYELVRYSGYSQPWYSQVEQWRKGVLQ